MAARRRLDAELVRRGLVTSRAEAQAAVSAGRVTVAGAPALKPARLVAADEPLRLLAPPRRFVSRGGDKLDAALDAFALDVTGQRALDAGASTGGFTDCLLQRGARSGGGRRRRPRPAAPAGSAATSGSWSWSARTCERSPPVPSAGRSTWWWPTCRSSRCAPSPLPSLGLGAPRADLVLLVKPQFEAGRAEASRGRGVIRDDAVRTRVREEVGDVLVGACATIMGWMESPLRGADGNVEYFVHALAPPGGHAP